MSAAVVNLLPPGFADCALREETRAGLTDTPKSLPSKWLHDALSSSLLEKIRELPEYYQTRVERAILGDVAGTIASLTGARTLIELGSGPSAQTRLLLGALRDRGTLEAYVDIDLQESTVAAARTALTSEYPRLAIRPVVADFEGHLGLPGYPATGPRLVVVLGSVIGTMTPAQRVAFLAKVRSRLRPGDTLLLGADLVKDPHRLAAAYDDSAGITAALDKNFLTLLNTRLGADFDLDAFDHSAAWVPKKDRVEMRLRSAVNQRVRVPGAGLTVRLDADEEILTGSFAKFRRDTLTSELAAAGLAVREWWADPADEFASCLSAAA